MNKSLNNLLENRILQNILASALLMLWFRIMLNGVGHLSFLEQLGLVCTLICPAIFLSLLTNYLILPFIRKKEFLKASIFYFSIMGLGSWLFTILAPSIQGVFCFFTECLLDIEEVLVSPLQIFSMVILVTLLALALRITRDYILEARAKKERKLKLLRSQLNSQFLLDTLRYFSDLAIRPHNNLPQAMLTLSDLLRFTLYESKEASVSLEREFQAVQRYLSLKQAYQHVDIECVKEGEWGSRRIVPMTLISVLDNAFAQLEASLSFQKKLTISLQIKSDRVEFSFQSPNVNHIQPLNLQLLRDRIDLQYQDPYELDTNSQNGTLLCLRLGL